jgi:hypothetical protein
MADVRSLLRAERAARAPTKKQKQAHTAQPSKKRKADDESTGESRKRTRAEEANDLPAGFFDGGAGDLLAVEDPVEVEETEEAPLPGFVAAKEHDPQIVVQMSELPPPTTSSDGTVPSNFFDSNKDAPNLDDEWAAFERDVAAVPAPPRQTALEAIQNGAVISAAPLSAEEVAAQAREEKQTQRVNREEELAAEKEDAARTLEDEFEEMEALEERVKRLREKREKLRASRQAGSAEVDTISSAPVEEGSKDDSEDEDEDEGDEWNRWGFGTS